MKILWLTEFFPASDAGEITGGVEARCFFVKKHLEKLGHSVKVVAESTSGQRWAHLSVSSLLKQITFLVHIFWMSLKELLSPFEIIEGTNYPTYFLASFIGILRHKPIVFWYPDVFLGSWVKNIGPVGLIGEIVERLALRLPVDLFVAISLSTRNKLLRAGVSKDKIVIIPCGVDEQEINQVKKMKLTKQFDICLVSRLVGYKKVEDLIFALAIIKKYRPKIKTAIVGQGPEKENLLRLAKKLHVDRGTKFIGYLPTHLDVLKVISQSKLFCLPSSAEGFGIVAIESAALGVPGVVSNIPVLSEVTENGKSGFIFSLGDPNDLAEKLRLLLSDKKLYRAKVRGALAIGTKFSWEKVASQTEIIYENLLSH